jgi:DNA adenine methylase
MKNSKIFLQPTCEPSANIEENLFDFSAHPAENINLNYSARSPLRYPGGKTRGVEFITQFFPKNLDKLLSPFFGGGSIELSVAVKGTIVFGYDVFSPLVEFWQCLLTQPNELANEVEKYYPLPKEKFYELQATQTKFKTKLERAAV